MNAPEPEIILTLENVDRWPKFKKLLDEGKVKADGQGRLRYLHGAPLGRLLLKRTNKDGTPIYMETADEWFDPESQRAREFVWP